MCRCKTRKTEIGCDRAKQGFTLDCDETCALKLQQSRTAAAEAERARREAEEHKNRAELLEFERKMGSKKKSKERRPVLVAEKQGLGWIGYTGVVVVAALVAVGVAVVVAADWLG